MAATPMTPVSERHQGILEANKGKTPLALRDWLLKPVPAAASPLKNISKPESVAPIDPIDTAQLDQNDDQNEDHESIDTYSWNMPAKMDRHSDSDSCVSVVDSSELQDSMAGLEPPFDQQFALQNNNFENKKRLDAMELLEQMRHWVKNAAQMPPNDPLQELSTDDYSHYRDVDTETGKLLLPVDYPHTIISLEVPSDENVAWRQMMASSSTHIKRAVDELVDGKGDSTSANLCKQQEETFPPSQEDKPPPFAECIIRPAKPCDFEKIAAIINMEVSTTRLPQVVENREVVADDIIPIFRHCQNTLRPFVVAVSSDDAFLDPSKWPQGSSRVYEQFVKFKESQADKEDELVYGFAFIGEPRIGFLNRPCQGARHSGLIRMIVHPDHRRRLIGSALLERMLSSVTPSHYQMVDYHWQCSDTANIYEESANKNTRQYSQVYIELFTSKKVDDDYAWKSKLLDKYSFKCVARFDDMVKTDRDTDNKWLDLTIWEHKLRKGSKLPHVPAAKYFAPDILP